MSEHYDFHYQPTGSGAISGQQVLQQTEDAINELGDYVNDNVGGAMDVAQQALETAQNAEQDAQTALDTANSFSGAIQSAQQDASTALSTAQTAQTTASNANNTAIQAQQDASSAVTTANNASGQVSTLSGTVTTLGQRVTTAEGNIGQNTSDITALTTRVGTAEGNITTLQNDVSIAQGNASSAMATAGQVKQQSYVFRYSSTALVASSTNSNALLDNTDNLKVGDKVIDSDGVLFSITAIDTVNSSFTIGSSLIDLAKDSDVVHTSGNETVGGVKRFTDDIIRGTTNTNSIIQSRNLIGKTTASTAGSNSSAYQSITATLNYSDSTPSKSISVNLYVNENAYSDGKYSSFRSGSNNTTNLGTSEKKWANVYATNYYYGANAVEFSDKFVTTDTAQTITGTKTFENVNIQLKSTNAEYSVSGGYKSVSLYDKNLLELSRTRLGVYSSGFSYIKQTILGYDSNNQQVDTTITFSWSTLTKPFLRPDSDNLVSLGTSGNRWKDAYTYLINGLTPSSLSLPSTRDNAIDISSYFTNFNNGDSNQYTPTVNGWIYLETTGCNALHCFCTTTNNLVHYGNTVARANDGMAHVTFPVLANTVFKCTWYTNSTITLNKAWFIPCQGNV